MSLHTLFVDAVHAAVDLPTPLREHAAEATDLEEHCYDESYLAFLDQQISLSPRGPEWTARLRRRLAALQAFCGVTLMRGRVAAGDAVFTVEIDPASRAVIHWEEYEA